jgi:hypothetical protein
MSQALHLYRLQQIDSQLDRTQARLASILETLNDDSTLKSAMEAFQKAEAEKKASEERLAQAETEVRNLRIKIELTESSLYSGTVRNPKELQDLQNDAAAMKRHLVTLEDRLLEAMVAAEEAEKAHQHAHEELERLSASRQEQISALLNEQAELEKKIQKLKVERLAIVEPLDPQLTALYEDLRRQRRGVAVTEILDQTCRACGTNLPPAQVQAARSPSQLSRCPSCGRILYAN